MELAGKVCVVTGAASGIGRSTALAFARRGAQVVTCDVDAVRLAAVTAELGARSLLSRTVDVADRTQMAAFADEVHALVPAADVVVNNAGVGMGSTFLETSLDDWDWLLGINLRGVIHGCHFFVPKMVARGTGGQVINISSILGIYAAPQVCAYVASKFAVLGLSQSMRAELAEHRIGVTAICPGMIATSIVESGRLNGKVQPRRNQMISAFKKSGASPEIVARAILEAVHTNPAVRTVGRDAASVAVLTRAVPGLTARIGSALAKRFALGQ